MIFFALGTLLKSGLSFFPQNTTPHYQTPTVQFQAPRQITIPTIDIKVAVTPGGIDQGNWILSEDKALFLPSSGLLGEGFNTIIYAHKREGLFVNLKKVTLGDKIWLEDQTGKSFIYKVYSVENIDPTNLEKLKSKTPNNLTLFTCDGWFDQSRLMVKAKREFLEDDISLKYFQKKPQLSFN